MKTRSTSSVLIRFLRLKTASLPTSLIGQFLSRRGFLLIPLVVTLASLAFSPAARAVCEPGCEDTNTFLGNSALYNNLTGSENTAVGALALWGNTSGSYNTGIGSKALEFNGGNNNTAIGNGALFGNNGTGSFNTATGDSALYSNTTGGFNVASGGLALFSNTTGNSNTATGYDALYSNQDGMNNTATGVETLVRNTAGSSNTALGHFALIYNTTGNNNIAVGDYAGSNLTTGNNNIDIGNKGVAGESKTIRIGFAGRAGQTATYIAGISGATVPAGVGVIIGTDGKLGTVVSSERFKGSIKPMDRTSEAILALKPVTFRYKHELDPDRIPQFGLVAEEVAKVNPDLVARDDEGKPYTVRYEAVNAMLLNEFLKEHRKVTAQDRRIQEQETTIAQLKSSASKQGATIAKQQEQIEALTTGLQKVSDQLELSKPAPQMVDNNQ